MVCVSLRHIAFLTKMILREKWQFMPTNISFVIKQKKAGLGTLRNGTNASYRMNQFKHKCTKALINCFNFHK